MVVFKTNRGNNTDFCKGMSGLKECYQIWKAKHLNPFHFALQRYIIPPQDDLSKIRVFFNIQKNSMSYRVISKKDQPASSDSKKGWTRLSKSRSDFHHESFFVRNSEELGAFDGELKNFQLQEQMKSLKKVIESVGCSDGSFLLLEIFADFIQDYSGAWYFLNVVNYKLEFVVNKKSTLPKMKQRNSSYVHLRRQVKVMTDKSISDTISFEERLVQEAVNDLGPKGLDVINSTQILYRKAYHLK